MTDSASFDDRQFDAWGVVVLNTTLRASHVANGLMQTLRALPELAAQSRGWERGETSIPRQFDKAVRQVVGATGPEATSLTLAARALCVTASKDGATSLSGDATPSTPQDQRIVEAGRAHIAELFGDPSAHLSEQQHALIAGALNADGRVYVKGGADPTTPGLSFAGYTSTHTLKPMHAATYLSLLANEGVRGAGLLRRLHKLARSSDDVHSRFVDSLDISVDPPWREVREDADLKGALPFPAGDGWSEFAKTATDMTARLFEWLDRGLSKQEAVMAVVDLIGLLLFARMLSLSAEDESALLLVGASAPRASDQAVVEASKRSLRAAFHRLDERSQREGLARPSKDPDGPRPWIKPSPLARALALATGWLFPRDARGGAKHYLSPGVRQLVTFTQCLVEPGEDLPWQEFHGRALELGVVLGGADESRAGRALGRSGAQGSLRWAGALNQRQLVDLGLARRESDNVVRVTGGR